MEQAYKSQLQTYALKQNLELPVYKTTREGPPHAPRFNSEVTFCGTTYKSPEFFPTLKASEHAAAKIALSSIAPPQSPEAASVGVAYKNLLQEIAQKQNSLLPVYETVGSGPSHAPTFTSSVEFNGRVFKGEEAKTKKLAEMNAARVAFMSIKYGNSNQVSIPSLNPNQASSPPCERQEEAEDSNVKRTVQEITSQQSPKIVTPDVPSKWVEVYEDDDNVNREINIVESPLPENPTNDAMNITVASSSSPPANNGALNAINKMDITVAAASPMAENFNNGRETLELCVEEEEEEIENERKKKTKLVVPNGSHVIVHPKNSEMKLPQDAELLFSDDRFVAYRLCVNP